MSVEYKLSVRTNRTEAIYQTQSRIDFLVELRQSDTIVRDGQVSYVLRKNMAEEVARGVLDLRTEPALISTYFGEPGFIDCTATFTPEKGDPVSARISAGVNPLDIAPSMPVPDDFNDFWDAQLARLEKIPLSPKLTATSSWDETIECFDTRVACVDDLPVSGYFARPIRAAAGSLPAVLTVHGAGVRSAARDVALLCAQRNWLAMNINAHGVRNGESDEYYAQLAKTELADYRLRGMDTRETCYFVGMFLRVRRALDFLAAQPEWNGRVLTVHGHSQGGYQAIAGAALDQRVSAFAAGIPAGCDLTGYTAGRPNGWPRMTDNVDGKTRDRWSNTARYIDAMNLITRTKAEAYFSVGCIDTSCNPTGVYAAYNNHAGRKQIIHCPDMGHGSPPEIDGAFTRSLMEHAKRMTDTPRA